MTVHLALVLALFPSLGLHRDQTSRQIHSGAWTLHIQTDRFAGRSRCQLVRSKVEYDRQAIIIHLSEHTDTSGAVYRVDGGPPITVASDAMELAHLGFNLHNDDLANPSEGLVIIPEHRVQGASAITVESRSYARSIKFKVDGLDKALTAARSLGCEPPDFY
jgi:hypothetical protein